VIVPPALQDGGRRPLRRESDLLPQVYVTDVNDHSPSMEVEALSPIAGRATTPEAAAVGSFVAHLIVTDSDAGANGRVSCRLDGQDSDQFRLQSVSAVQVRFGPLICLVSSTTYPFNRIRFRCRLRNRVRAVAVSVPCTNGYGKNRNRSCLNR